MFVFSLDQLLDLVTYKVQILNEIVDTIDDPLDVLLFRVNCGIPNGANVVATIADQLLESTQHELLLWRGFVLFLFHVVFLLALL